MVSQALGAPRTPTGVFKCGGGAEIWESGSEEGWRAGLRLAKPRPGSCPQQLRGTEQTPYRQGT